VTSSVFSAARQRRGRLPCGRSDRRCQSNPLRVIYDVVIRSQVASGVALTDFLVAGDIRLT
jgi:hypothetical protein